MNQISCFRCDAWPCTCSDGISVICGESVEVIRRLNTDQFDAVITDPPYSSGGQYRSDRTKSTSTKYQQTSTAKEYADFSGDNRDQRSFLIWCNLWLFESLRVTKQGGMVALFTDWRQLPSVTDAIQVGGWVWRGIAVWDKTAGCWPTLGRFSSQSEFIVWGSNGPMPTRDDATTHPGVFSHFLNARKKLHLTAKPVEVMRGIVAPVVDDGLILDPFAGSGTTLVAARDMGKRAIGIELDPDNCQIIVDRLAQHSLF